MTISRRDAVLGSLAVVPTLAITPFFGKAAAAPSWALPAKRQWRAIENTWIPMPDGARLAARLWIPEGAEKSPVPVVLEYIPYRMRDAYRVRDDRGERNSLSTASPMRESTCAAPAIQTA